MWNPKWKGLEKLYRKSQRKMLQELDAQAEHARICLAFPYEEDTSLDNPKKRHISADSKPRGAATTKKRRKPVPRTGEGSPCQT